MRFTTKTQEFEQLKTDLLDKLAAYQQEVQKATYEELKSPGKATNLVSTYADLVESNAAFRTFLNTDKLHIILGRNVI